jgi:uncharacterized phiE125 gp8 family phage protein
VFPPSGGIGLFGSYNSLGLYGSLVAYGSLKLTESSPPQSFTEPLSLSEVKAYLKVPERSPADTAEDDGILSLITAAREQAEILQGRDLVQKQFDLHHDYWPSYRVELRAPLVAVDLVQYTDSNGEVWPLVENADYIVDRAKEPGVLVPPYNQTWPTFQPWPSSALLIRFTSGYNATSAWWSDAGARVKNGMKLLISAWYNNRLPFEKGAAATNEYPYTVTSCLSFGSIARAR